MAEKLFGSDGARGPYDPSQELGHINESTFSGLAYAYTELIAETTSQPPTFIIGGDTRHSTPGLIEAASDGAAAAGAEVWQIGTAPTPAIAWAAQKYNVNAIAITASHNPNGDNGFKAFAAGGVKPNRTTLDEIEWRYWKQPYTPTTSNAGRIHERPGLIQDYAQAVFERLGGDQILRDRLVVVDGANGAAHELAPQLYRALGAEVITFACDPAQGNINDNCGAAQLQGLKQFLAERPEITSDRRFLGAFANDGDADRIMGVDQHGRFINGNHWMDMLADPEQAGIVGTLYTNSALRQAVTERGVAFYECDNGDSNVTALLHELTKTHGPGYTRGGEFTGHLIDTDWLPSGDGLLMGGAMAVNAALRRQSFAEVYDGLHLWPEQINNVHIGNANAKAMVASEALQSTKTELEQRFGAAARIVLRASGTEPLIRIWAEAAEQAAATEIVTQLTAQAHALAAQ